MADLETDQLKVTDEEWENYKKKFEKQYDVEENLERRKIYEETKKFITEHNRKFEVGEVKFSMGINQFSDRKQDEPPCCCMKRQLELNK